MYLNENTYAAEPATVRRSTIAEQPRKTVLRRECTNRSTQTINDAKFCSPCAEFNKHYVERKRSFWNRVRLVFGR